MMNYEYYKKKLEEEKIDLTEQLEQLGRRIDDDSDDWVAVPDEDDGFSADGNEEADEVEDFEARIAIFTPLEERYHEVDEAIDRIESDEYGICIVCEEKIDEDRLEANPAANTCKEHMNGDE